MLKPIVPYIMVGWAEEEKIKESVRIKNTCFILRHPRQFSSIPPSPSSYLDGLHENDMVRVLQIHLPPVPNHVAQRFENLVTGVGGVVASAQTDHVLKEDGKKR